jgi:hypothetical protein
MYPGATRLLQLPLGIGVNITNIGAFFVGCVLTLFSYKKSPLGFGVNVNGVGAFFVGCVLTLFSYAK